MPRRPESIKREVTASTDMLPVQCRNCLHAQLAVTAIHVAHSRKVAEQTVSELGSALKEMCPRQTTQVNEIPTETLLLHDLFERGFAPLSKGLQLVQEIEDIAAKPVGIGDCPVFDSPEVLEAVQNRLGRSRIVPDYGTKPWTIEEIFDDK